MRKPWTMAAVLTLALAACGTSDETAGDPADPSTATTPPETTTTVSAEELSLGDFLGFGFSDDPDAQQQQYEEQERQIQESIRSCMAEQGFEYIPMDFSQQSFIFEDFDQEEFVRTQGFGITTWFGNEEEFFGPEEEFFDNDPNQAIIEAMSEGERDAYFVALYGDQSDFEPQIDPETGEEIFEFTGFGSGCDGQAYEAVYGAQNQVYEDLGPAFEEMYERVQADPRIVAVQAEWSGCMSDAGYDFATQDDMYAWVYEDIQARADEILNVAYVDPFEGWDEAEIEAFFEEKTQEEIEAYFREFESQQSGAVDEEALAALQEEEIALAVADFECSKGFQEAFEEVSAEYEKQFIRDNLEQLQDIRDAQGG